MISDKTGDFLRLKNMLLLRLKNNDTSESEGFCHWKRLHVSH